MSMMQDAVQRAVECVERNMAVGDQADIQSVCTWAVGAAFRYLRGEPEPTTFAPIHQIRPEIDDGFQRKAAKTPSVTEQLKKAKAQGFTGNICTGCGGTNMVRTGTCETCQNCFGTSGGCS